MLGRDSNTSKILAKCREELQAFIKEVSGETRELDTFDRFYLAEVLADSKEMTLAEMVLDDVREALDKEFAERPTDADLCFDLATLSEEYFERGFHKKAIATIDELIKKVESDKRLRKNDEFKSMKSKKKAYQAGEKKADELNNQIIKILSRAS